MINAKGGRPIDRKSFIKKTGAGIVGIGITGCAKRGKLKQTSQPDDGYHEIGTTGIRVNPLGFGATRTDQPPVMKRVLDSGVNFFDTGRMYAEGRNEELLGKVIVSARHDVVIQSKFHNRYSSDAAAIEKSIDESLTALGRDYIDIMLFRWPPTPGDLFSESVAEAFDRAKEKGKIRASGFSTHENQADMVDAAVKAGFYDIALVAYNHAGNYTHPNSGRFYEWDQTALERSIERAAASGMGIIAMKTCAGGPMHDKNTGKATYAAAIRRALDNPNVHAAIPAMANFREAEEDLKVMEM